MALALWPWTVKTGEPEHMTPNFMDTCLVMKCELKLADPALPVDQRMLYRMLLSHGLLDSMNHVHGQLRALVKKDGSGKSAEADLVTAWDNVKKAYDNVVGNADPTLPQLNAGLFGGIDHGGSGG
jgi:hypothetical protein